MYDNSRDENGAKDGPTSIKKDNAIINCVLPKLHILGLSTGLYKVKRAKLKLS